MVLLGRPGPIPGRLTRFEDALNDVEAQNAALQEHLESLPCQPNHSRKSDTVQTIDGDFRSLSLFVLVKQQPNKVKRMRMMATWVIQ